MAELPKSIQEKLTSLFDNVTEIKLATTECDTAEYCKLSISQFSRHYGYSNAVDAILVPFHSVNVFLGLNFSIEEARSCCQSFIAMHGNLNLADIAAFYGRLKLGQYPSPSGRYTITSILSIFNTYYFDVMRIKTNIAENLKNKTKELDEQGGIGVDEWIELKKNENPDFQPNFTENVKKILRK